MKIPLSIGKKGNRISFMNWFAKNSAYFAWIVVLISISVSLYFSEIRLFAPCVLCWVQRIAMYPLIFILTVGILRKDKNLPYYILPLSIFGLIVAFYHTLLNYGIIPEKLAPCQFGVSCTTKYIQWFGFVTIPLLSFSAFLLITLFMVLYMKGARK